MSTPIDINTLIQKARDEALIETLSAVNPGLAAAAKAAVEAEQEPEQDKSELLFQLEGMSTDPIDYVPLYDRVVIAVTKKLEARAGIHMPETSTQINMEGVVVAVGVGRILPGCSKPQPLQVAVGNLVNFAPHDGRDVVLADRKRKYRLYRIMPEDKIMGILSRQVST